MIARLVLAAAAVMAAVPAVAVADPTVLPSPSESYSLGPAPTSPATTPTPDVEVGTAVQTRRRTVRTCAATFTVIEERVDGGPWRAVRRTIHRHPCRIPTVIEGGL